MVRKAQKARGDRLEAIETNPCPIALHLQPVFIYFFLFFFTPNTLL